MNIKIQKLCQIVSIIGLYRQVSIDKDETIYTWFNDSQFAYAVYFYQSQDLWLMQKFKKAEKLRRFCEQNNIVCK
jgi:hypothetical protein